jgi:hypothetical protein
MQLVPLTAAAAALLAATAAGATPPVAEPGASSRAAVYQDDDATTVVTTAVTATVPLGELGAVRAAWLADVVTSASVDVVTAATRPVHERRDELRAGLDVRAGDALVSADWAHSTETDYGADRLSLAASLDLAGRATTLGARAATLFAEVGRAGDPAFAESLRVWSASLELTEVADARTVVSVTASGELAAGHQASPYRFVAVADGTALPETHPTGRARASVTVRVRRSLSPEAAAAIDERLYRDDWGISASSTTARLILTLTPRLDLELRNRLHVQSSASFWQRRYERRRRFMSGDRELSALIDDFAGPAIVYEARGVGPFERLRLDAGAEAFVYRFLDTDRIDGRLGVQVTAGVEGRL